MVLGPQNTRCFRHCLLAVTEAVSLLQDTCPEMSRGDVSALVSAFSELFAAMNCLCSMFLPATLQFPVSVKEIFTFDFCLTSVDPVTLTLSSKMIAFLAAEPLTVDLELLFRQLFWPSYLDSSSTSRRCLHSGTTGVLCSSTCSLFPRSRSLTLMVTKCELKG